MKINEFRMSYMLELTGGKKLFSLNLIVVCFRQTLAARLRVLTVDSVNPFNL